MGKMTKMAESHPTEEKLGSRFRGNDEWETAVLCCTHQQLNMAMA